MLLLLLVEEKLRTDILGVFSLDESSFHLLNASGIVFVDGSQFIRQWKIIRTSHEYV